MTTKSWIGVMGLQLRVPMVVCPRGFFRLGIDGVGNGASEEVDGFRPKSLGDSRRESFHFTEGGCAASADASASVPPP